MKTEKEKPPYLPQEEKDNTDHEKVRKTVAAAKEEVFLQRRKGNKETQEKEKKIGA